MNPDPIQYEVATAAPEVPTTAGMTTKVVKGSLWTLAGQVAPLGVSLFTTPFVIRLLGSEGYGVLILVGLIPIYLSFADFGMGNASTKFASEAYIAGDRQREAGIIRASFLIAFLSALPISICVFLFARPLSDVLNVPEDHLPQAITAFQIIAVTFLFNILSSILNTPLLNRLRMDLNVATSAVPKALMLIVTPIVIFLGGGIIGAIWVVFITSLVIVVGQLYYANKFLPELFAWRIDIGLIPPLLKFGLGMVIAVFAVVLLQNLEKFLLPALVSVEALAFYSVAFTFANMTTMFAASMVQSMIPAFSQLLSSKKKEEFDALFSRGIRLNLIWLPPVLMVLFVAARPFFSVWAGEDFGREATYPFYILLIGLVLNIIAYIPYSSITALGRTDLFAKLYWIEALVFVYLTYMLINNFGILGAALGWSIRMVVDGCVLMYLSKSLTGTSLNLRRHFQQLLMGAVILSPPMLFAVLIDNFSLFLLLLILPSVLIYFLFVWKVLVEDNEKKWLITQARYWWKMNSLAENLGFMKRH